jgi:hypothetical protein
MTLALSACIGMTLAAFFTALRTFSKKQHPNGNNKPWNGGWLDRQLETIETWQRKGARWRIITRSIY